MLFKRLIKENMALVISLEKRLYTDDKINTNS